MEKVGKIRVVTPIMFPQAPKLKKPATVVRIMNSRERTLEELYVRRATVENAIRSLEIYAASVSAVSAKLIALR